MSVVEGESILLTEWLDSGLAETIFQTLAEQIPFRKMSNFGSDVPRLVAVQHAPSREGDVPVYRHPTDASPPSQLFSPIIANLVSRINALLGTSLNHALIQHYRTGVDNISEHSDKTIDIVPGSVIVNASFGAQRTMTLRCKANRSSEGVREMKENIAVPLPHNSLFVMTLETNAAWTHAIRANKRAARDQSEAELSYNGSRISLTLREIGTFITPDGRIYGSGARNRCRSEACQIDPGESAWDELILGFGKENKGRSIDFGGYYARGSDALH
ncbi:protein of unknown function [Taphrina deformans PYCC 5710]|uniref:Fe2OG dioxygenase domain-containing protein n=1 Tax=Taphrina deformans (strain PYCC 5710 / ATCC 11124 / CBS 356.35 / IMI 108563 / JCM 9778 / NBRC 8474) TaxID=1097556 RepID=R4XHP5_TAPDE|nr:protein of unknown function [Taphrina deformans PYCC 5710]|eukprot:CCG84043.1 protein of unknown function [Taphrina deformans PYCC 5710]